MKLIHAIAAAAVSCAAVPALAEPAAPPIPAPDSQAKIDPKTDMRRVCLVDDVTGTRVPMKTCQTRAQWIAQTGKDPLALRR